MPIVFTCPSCGKQLQAKDEYAGKRSKCTGCGQVVTIPAASQPKPSAPGQGQPSAPGQGKPSAPSQPASAPPPSAQPPAPAAGAGQGSFLNFLDEELKDTTYAPVEANTRRCPGCGKAIPLTSVLCIHCGYHFEKGKQLKTIHEGPEESPFQAPQSGGKPGTKSRKAPRARSGGSGSSEDNLEATDILLCVCCTNIACIVAIVYLITGNPRGGKMLMLAIAIQVFWFIVGFVAQLMQMLPTGGAP